MYHSSFSKSMKIFFYSLFKIHEKSGMKMFPARFSNSMKSPARNNNDKTDTSRQIVKKFSELFSTACNIYVCQINYAACAAGHRSWERVKSLWCSHNKFAKRCEGQHILPVLPLLAIFCYAIFCSRNVKRMQNLFRLLCRFESIIIVQSLQTDISDRNLVGQRYTSVVCRMIKRKDNL